VTPSRHLSNLTPDTPNLPPEPPINCPPVLYKYTELKHAIAMVRHGAVRIGTMYDYRKEESHGAAIGDSGEGTKTTYIIGHGEEITSNEQLPEFLRGRTYIGKQLPSSFIPPPGGFVQCEKMILTGKLSLNLNCEDCYLFCTSAAFDLAIMDQFTGADACVQIHNPVPFLAAITCYITDKAQLFGVHACCYQDRQAEHTQDKGYHPALIKPVRYASQREWRAIWAPTSHPIQPFILPSPTLARYCSLRWPRL